MGKDSNVKALLKPKVKKHKRDYIGRREVVDMSTGELVDVHPIYKTKQKELNYIMMILSDEDITKVLSGLGSSGKVLSFILKEFNDKSCMFYFSTSNKERMVDDLGLSIGTIRSAVREFNITGILCHVRGSEYMLNPNVFYKGSLDKRIAFIELYDKHRILVDSKKVKTEI